MICIKNLLTLLIGAVALISCGEKDPVQDVVPVESISINPEVLTLSDGETGTVTATVKPDNATDKTIVWSSQNTSVATVNEGVVHPVAPGSTYIVAMSADGKVSAKCFLTVTPPAPPATSLQLRIMSFNILQGGKKDGSTDTAGHEWTTVRKGPCVSMFKDIDPDIAILQECRREQLNDLKASLTGYTYYCYAKDGVLASGYSKGDAANDASFKNAGQRNVIMLRAGMFTVLEWGRYWLSDTPDTPSTGFGTTGQKVTLWQKLLHNESGKEFYIFNTHNIPQSYGNAVSPVVDVITPCNKVNIEQMKAIVGSSGLPLFFGGDLNSNDASDRMAELNAFLHRSASDVSEKDPSMTFNGFREDSSTWTLLDHIYYRGATPLTYKVVNSAGYGTRFISDHFPIYCDFLIE